MDKNGISAEAGLFQRAAIFLIFLIGPALPVNAQVTAESDSAFLESVYHYYSHPIDPALYIVRPGEQLIVTFLNSSLPALGLAVGPQGRIVHRNLGTYDLAGKSLAEARTTLYEPLRQLYRVDDIDISVSAPYRVSVAVTGAVAFPGTYIGYTSTSASEMIARAGGVLPSGSTRHIVMSGGVQDIPVDLDRVTYLGDNSADPCLYAGTRIIVPKKSQAVVTVVGEVNSRRDIELLQGDDLPLLIALAGGPTRNGDPKAAYVIGDIGRNLSDSGSIRPMDIIMVPLTSEASGNPSVSIFGAVAKPGRYPYSEGATLGDLLQAAGGMTERANSKRTAIFRRPLMNEWGRTPDIRYPVTASSAQDNNLDAMALRAADSVFVPVLVGYVNVSGRVRNPGYYPFKAGQSAQTYINVAGGYAADADRSEVIIFNRVAGMSYPLPPDANVSDGDEVMVQKVEILK